jgi:hypothetical protein
MVTKAKKVIPLPARQRAERRVFLNPEQERELREHLARDIPAAALSPAMQAINWQLKHGDFDERSRARSAATRKQRFSHRERMVRAVADLIELIYEDRPGWTDINWQTLVASLDELHKAARIERSIFEPHGRRGRKLFDGRDGLVSVAFSVYPRGTAKKSVGSRFEHTVEMLFRFLGIEVEDVHSVILDALRRQPIPPVMMMTM